MTLSQPRQKPSQSNRHDRVMLSEPIADSSAHLPLAHEVATALAALLVTAREPHSRGCLPAFHTTTIATDLVRPLTLPPTRLSPGVRRGCR